MSGPAPGAAPPAKRGPFGAVAVAGLLVTGIGAFAILVVLAAYAPDLEGDRAGGGSALSRSAVGFAGAVALMKALGVPVAVSRDAPAGRKRRSAGLLVLTPPVGRDAAAVRAAVATAGTTLIVLPKWDTARDPDHPGWVRKAGPLALAQVQGVLPAPATLNRGSGEGRPVLAASDDADFDVAPQTAGPVESLQTLDPSDTWEAALLDGTGKAVLARWTDHDLYVLTDPDLLDTQGLRDLATAGVARTILDTLRDGGPLTFDVTLNGFSKVRSLLRLLFEPPLFGGTLCAAAAALAILLMAVRRFAPPAPEGRGVALGKRALADNAARLIARAGREPAMALPYAQAVRAAVARALGTRPVSDAALDALARSLHLPDTYSDLRREAEDAVGRPALMRVADRLHRWAQGMNRGHR